MNAWYIWLQTLPRITREEVGVVVAAVVCFYLAPVLLAWTATWRRLRPEAPAGFDTDVRSGLPSAEVPAAAPSDASTEIDRFPVPPVDEPAGPGLAQPAAPGLPVANEPAVESSVPAFSACPEPAMVTEGVVRLVPAPDTAVEVTGISDEIRPAVGDIRHRFRMDELRRARLADWPPRAIREHPQRFEAWKAAERLVDGEWSRIGRVVIASPYPARSACLGGAETVNGGRYRVHFLLFPVLWPVTEDQAVAQAVFEIDPTSGALRGWVDALHDSELTPDHRRELLASG